MVIGLFPVATVQAVYTDYEKTDYQRPVDLPAMSDAFDLNTAISRLTSDITDFDPSSLFKSGDDWAKEADRLKTRNAQLLVQYNDKSKTSEERIAVSGEIKNNFNLIKKANKLAILKYSEDNSKGKNNNKISQRHIAISQNLDALSRVALPGHRRSADVGIDLASLAALEAATETYELNVIAWDARIQLLDEMGRHDEAIQVKDEMNQRVGSTALDLLSLLSPIPALISIVLAETG